MASFLQLALCATFLLETSSIKITNLLVPGSASHDTLLDCRYNLEGDKLYVVKWYKDEEQFFECLPSGEVHLHPVEGVNVYHSGLASVGSCPLTLTGLNTKSSGEYKCEVTTEGPDFKFETASAKFTFLRATRPPTSTTTDQALQADRNDLVRDDMKPKDLNTTWNAYTSKGTTTSQSLSLRSLYLSAYSLILYKVC